MAFHVSTLYNLPFRRSMYFLYVIDVSGGEHSDWIRRNMTRLGETAGSNVGIVSGPNELTREVFDFLEDNLSSDFAGIEGVLHETTCLLISEGTLLDTQSAIYLIPVTKIRR